MTKDELEQENAELRARVAELETHQSPRPNTRPKPTEPSFGLSEGSRNDLEMAAHRMETENLREEPVVSSPFTGKPLNRSGDGRDDEPAERD